MAGWRTRREVREQPFTVYDETGLQALLDSFDTRMKRLNDQYLRMMGEHIRDIGTLWPSDVHRLQQIRRMNRNLRELERRIADVAGRSEAEIERVFEQVAAADVRMATKILGVQDTSRVMDNPALQRILRAQARETAQRMKNLSNTTVVSRYYRNAIDEGVSAVQSGVEDYNSAIRRVIREAGQSGLRVTDRGTRVVDYESGYARRLDTAARMNILDGVRHLNQSLMEEVAHQFGANGVEIDAHMLCAEDHLPYQGGQYSNDEFERIQDSLPRPFGEWNCRHTWHGIILGVSPPTYTPEQLGEMRRFSTETITIDGRTKTRYQWSQEMHRCEVAIRQKKDLATLARASGDESLRRRCQSAIVDLNKYYGELAEKAGVRAEYQRTFVAGFRDVKLQQESASGLTGTANGGTIDSEGREILYRLENGQYGDRNTQRQEWIQKMSSNDIVEKYMRHDPFSEDNDAIDPSFTALPIGTQREIIQGFEWVRRKCDINVFPRKVQLGSVRHGATGGYDDETQTITIKRSIKKKEGFRTGVHEFVHHVDNINGVFAKAICKDAETRLLESGQCDATDLFYMRYELAGALQDNPRELLAYSVEAYAAGTGNPLSNEITELFVVRCSDYD